MKDLRKTGKIAGTVHNKSITREQIRCLFEKGQLGPADSKDPVQLQQTAWFYITCFFGKRGRENQRSLRKDSFTLRVTEGREYYEIDRALPGSLPVNEKPLMMTKTKVMADVLLFLIHGSRTITPRTITPGQLPPGQLPPRTNTPRTITPPDNRISKT